MNLLPIIGYSIIAIVGVFILAACLVTWALSTLPDDTEE
jgi:hypothetical protein